jgi:2,3-bisphosphoglycerate-independent phosphoglycerate mutase
LTQAFVENGLDKFPRTKLDKLFFVTMTEYEKKYDAIAAFGPLEGFTPLAKVLSDNNVKQFHIAETDKYAHVTYFFNGGIEAPYPNEDRLLVPSLPSSNYEKTPEMSARKITEEVLKRLDQYQFILINFANADMVGHTGSYEATVKALETLNVEVGKIVEAVLQKKGTVIITGDHGNAEEKRYKVSGERRTKHSLNPVPLFLIDKKYERKTARTIDQIKNNYSNVGGVISDVAPTILELMKIPRPSDMTGISLLGELTKNN